ncbi:Dual specificity protein phosphatase cdc14a [Chytriomyces hyalinus]|nr:Dual specificity protein phosphatase cdc14a [Chytriomyces hyalinus]
MPYSTFRPAPHTPPSYDALANAKEFIKDRLYFAWLPHIPSQQQNVHFFSIDATLIYISFYSDFGPNSLAHVIRFCDLMKEKFNSPQLQSKKICLYSSTESDKRANAAFLMCAYMMLVQKQTPEEAFYPLINVNPPFIPYRDAGYGAATYHITILDCLKGVYKALNLGLIHVENLDAVEYEFYEKVEHGDLNWITDKFIAMACPRDDASVPQFQGQPYMYGGRPSNPTRRLLQPAYKMDDLISLLKERGTTTVVRLNNKTYEKKKFVDAGLQHVELYFPDGTTPPEGILKRFLDLVESQPGVIAIHCKAGLGRTGTLIACYLMKHYKFSASEVIGLLRVLRPGSVVGPQQNYLAGMQTKLWRMHPSGLLPSDISMLRPPTFPTSTRYPATHTVSRTIRNSADHLSAAMGKLHHHQKPNPTHADFMVLDNDDDALEIELGSISMEDNEGFIQVGPAGGFYERESPVTLAAAAKNMTEIDSYQPLELQEGGGVMYAGYAVPVQPRKQIGSSKREPASHTPDDWRSTTPNTTTVTDPLSAHAHSSSQPPSSSSKNYAYTTRPATQGNSFVQPTSSSQGAQTRYNLRPTTGVSTSRPATQSQPPRSFKRPEASGIDSLVVSGQNLDKLKTGASQQEEQQQQQQHRQTVRTGKRN